MKNLASILGSIVVLCLLAGGGFWWWLQQSANHQLAKAEQTAGNAVVAKGEALTKADAQTILANARVREIHTVTIQKANDARILQAPGADAPLDPAFIRAVNLGLCDYETHRNEPGCVSLRSGPAPVVPKASPVSRITLP